MEWNGGVDVRTALESQGRARGRDESVRAAETLVDGFVTCSWGESIQEIKFAVEFVERPVLLFGSELEPNSVLIAGRYPVIFGTVKEFKTKKSGDIGEVYTGAVLAIVVTGDMSTKGQLNWMAAGKAYTNPARIGLEDV